MLTFMSFMILYYCETEAGQIRVYKFIYVVSGERDVMA